MGWEQRGGHGMKSGVRVKNEAGSGEWGTEWRVG